MVEIIYIRFIGWLKRHRGVQHKNKIVKKCRKYSITWDNIISFIEEDCQNHIIQDDKRGDKFIKIVDRDWADAELIRYQEEIPGQIQKRGHHGDQILLTRDNDL